MCYQLTSIINLVSNCFQELTREDEPIEVVFVSEDSSPEELLTYMSESHGDWLAVQHGANLAR